MAAVIDWFSRYVLSWGVSTTMEVDFCLSALQRALRHGSGRPEVFNTDQRAQVRSQAFTDILKDCGIAISMDGRGRALDNMFVERLWRTARYEEVYLNEYQSISHGEHSARGAFRTGDRDWRRTSRSTIWSGLTSH